MTNDFRDEFRRSLAGELDPRVQPFQDELDRFCTWLNDDFKTIARFSIEGGAHPSLRRVIVRPRGRRNESSTLLVFYLDSASARAMGGETFLVGNADGLHQSLVSYVGHTSFREVHEMLRRRATEPIEGIFRTADALGRDPNEDVFALIEPENFFPVADAIEANVPVVQELFAEAVRKHGIGNGEISEANTKWLVAGGYALRGSVEIVEATASGQRLKLTILEGYTLESLKKRG